MLRIAETQSQLGPALAAAWPTSAADGDMYLRNIEGLLQRMLADQEQGRLHSTAELRNEIRVLTRTIAAALRSPTAMNECSADKRFLVLLVKDSLAAVFEKEPLPCP